MDALYGTVFTLEYSYSAASFWRAEMGFEEFLARDCVGCRSVVPAILPDCIEPSGGCSW